MQTTKLKDVFLVASGELEDRLRGKLLPRDLRDVQDIIGEHVRALLAGDNDFVMSLNTSDTQLLRSVLAMAAGFQKLSLTGGIDFARLSAQAEHAVESPAAKVRTASAAPTDVWTDLVSAIPTVICAFINPWLTLAAAGATVAVRCASRHSNEPQPRAPRRKGKAVSVMVDVAEVTARLADICEEVDNIIDKIRRIHKEAERALADALGKKNLENMYPGLLNAVQYLAAEDTGQSDAMKQLIFELRKYGYRVEKWPEGDARYFEKQPNPKVAKTEMHTPAIVKTDDAGHDTLVAQGILFVPQQ